MSSKEKADELVEKFRAYANTVDGDMNYINATQCAIIAVEEIIAYQSILVEEFGSDADGYTPQYWNEVLSHLRNKI